MSETGIADMLAEYRALKSELKVLRDDMVKAAVEHCGLGQEHATNCDIYAFLDGYLRGRGVVPAKRKQACP
jgi:hypothetical protein